MARNLDEQIISYQDPRLPSPAPPPQQHQSWQQPWSQTPSAPTPMPYPSYNHSQDFTRTTSLTFTSPRPQPQPQYRAPSAQPSTHTPYPDYSPPSIKQSSGPPSLISPLPTIATLSAALPSIQQPNHDPNLKITWCRDVLFLVDRLQKIASTDTPVGPNYISDPQLARLAQIAVPLVLRIASTQPIPNPMPIYIAEALYLRATFASSGAHPDLVPHSPRSAFRDFEQAARGGYASAWFKLGRDYENFNDIAHARECFERGVKLGVESCVYVGSKNILSIRPLTPSLMKRMGMALLMGQLGLAPNPEQAVPLLHRAATLASLEVPQPAYVYGLLLLGEFSQVTIPPNLFRPFIPPGSSPTQEARKHLERAAYLNFSPAQYKLGHAYEFAQPPFPFDALLSVQYYSLASQQGENEADMALSKWFLCGSEGAFEKDESLAWTFAEKAARKGLASAEFAMGYYAEVGVGNPKDVDLARKWYIKVGFEYLCFLFPTNSSHKASEHGNADAAERLQALSQPQPQALSRQEHNSITENKLIRKRTQAMQRTAEMSPPNSTGPGLAPPSQSEGRRIVEIIRKNSVGPPQAPAVNMAQHRLQTLPEHSTPTISQQPPQQQRQRISSPDLVGLAAPRARPAQSLGPQRAPPSQHRYTLTDSPTPPPPSQNVAVVELVDGPVNARQVEEASQPRPTPHKGPTTFAEMGFQSAKPGDKDCVIM